MSLKRKLISTLMIIVLTILCSAQSINYAGTVVTNEKDKKHIGILVTRQTDQKGYSMGDPGSNGQGGDGAIIWNLVEYSSASDDTYTENNIYCLKEGVGFSISNKRDTYNLYYNMKSESDRNDLKQLSGSSYNERLLKEIATGKTIDDSINSYDALLALMDIIYIKNVDSEDYIDKLLANADITFESDGPYSDGEFSKENKITTDQIMSVQQAAIWYFTNYGEENGKYDKTNKTDWFWYTNDNGITYKTLSDFENRTGKGEEQAKQAERLYKYLINAAKEGASKYASGIDSNEAPATIVSDGQYANLKSEQVGKNYIIGPMKVQPTQGNTTPYTVTLSVKNGETDFENYKLLDKEKRDVNDSKTVQDLVGEDFYISVPKENTTTVKVNIKIDYQKTDIDLWTKNLVSTDEKVQPIAIPKRTPQNEQKELSVTPTPKVFDLSLRKYITKVGETVLTGTENSRDPQISTDTIASEKTATYNHRKDPVPVKKGDKVTYKITVYNEGELNGRPEEIIDQLPDGLRFNENIKSGKFTKGSYDSGTNRLTFKRITGNQDNLKAYSGSGDLSSETIEFECEVTKDPGEQDIVLTNVAWISKEYNAEEDITIINEPNLDRDSIPQTSPKINGSDVNKDNMQDYKGNEQNDSVTPSKSNYFYKGQEDDDDFEKLILAKQITGTYSLKIVKEDSTNGHKLSGAVFNVNNENKSQTNDSGEVMVETNTAIPSAQYEKTYTIKETTAPTGYNKFDGTIQLTVKAKLQDGKYIIDKSQTTMTGANNGEAQLEVNEETGLITITVKDTPITGSYSLKIVKEDSTNGHKLSGAVFNVNNENKDQTNTSGEVIVEENTPLTEGYTKKYTIKETTAPTGYNKFDGTIEVNVKTKVQDGHYVIDTNQTTMTVKDASESDITQSAPVTIDKNTGLITITVKDTPITGSYSLKIVKEDSTDGHKLNGAVFNVNNEDKNQTNDSGEVMVETTTAIPSAEYEKTYTIKETTAPTGYNKFDGTIEVNVKAKVQDGHYVLDTDQTTMTVKDASESDITQSAPVTIDKNTGLITITVKDTPITGSYSLKIVKVDSVSGNKLKGAVFTVDDQEKPATETNGEVIVEENTPLTEGYTKKYTIKETTAPTGYNKFDGTIEVNVKAKVQDGHYVLDTDQITMTVKDAEGSEIRENIPAEIDKTTGLITIKVKDTPITGSYSLKIVKEDSANGKKLKGAVFTVDDQEKPATETNGEVIVEENTAIPSGEYEKTYTIKEKTAPTGYSKFDGTIEVNVKAKVQDGQYIIDVDQTTMTVKNAQGGIISDNIPVTIDKNIGSITITVKDVKKVFDLSLRKYITKVGETVLTGTENSRDPQILTNTIANEKTATYNHRKDPVPVKKGDIVTYKITVYNEGELDGRPEQIIDQLPEGLEFNDRIISGDFVKESYDKATNRLIFKRTDGNQENLSAYTGGSDLDSETIEFECVVTKEPDYYDPIVLTNIAWISKEYNAVDEVEIVNQQGLDRDSTPGNSPKINEVDVNKDNMQDYKGNSQNNNVTPSNPSYFYKGQEDDDDFEKLILNPEVFDLKLVKRITEVNKKPVPERIQEVDVSKLNTRDLSGNVITTADYKLDKNPVEVKTGDIVKYTFRVYNEGTIDGYAEEITENIPEGLSFLWSTKTGEDLQNDDTFTTAEKEAIDFNQQFWVVSKQNESNKITEIKTNALSKEENEEENLIKAFGKNEDGSKTQEDLYYKEVSVMLKVEALNGTTGIIKNDACISDDADSNGNDVTDRDSSPEDWEKQDSDKFYDEDQKWPIYEEDDEDYDNVILKVFDLSLRKYITAISKDIIIEDSEYFDTREPQVDTSKLNKNDEDGNLVTTAEYNHSKEPIVVSKNDIVIYMLRVYNEGSLDGYAAEIKDYLPPYLEFVKGTFNDTYGWEVSEDGRIVTTTYLNDTLIKAAVEKENGEIELNSAEIPIMCKVKDTAISNENITNIAEITKYLYDDKTPALDRDSTANNIELPEDANLPSYKDDQTGNYIPGQEDDDDFEKIIVKKFDLALRKFITKVNDQDVDTRIPQVKYEDEKITYEHTKEPVDVVEKDTVIYTIRVYNEGELNGYASEISDDLPDGLEFLPEHELNKEMRWVMYDENGEKTEDIAKAKRITTDYLSKEQGEERMANSEENEENAQNPNLLKAFDPNAEISDTNPDHKEVKVAFKVVEPNGSSKIIVNAAQITDDTDENGNEIEDEDSIPDEWNDGEDDQDNEYLKLTNFDLALRKWVTQAIVIENGKQTVTNTGHGPYDDPEDVVKVELHRKKLNQVTVKFRYSIRVINEGDIEGYAKEVTDYIPQGLKFVQEDNPSWTPKGDNIIATKALENTLLKPGEYADVEVLLTWENNENNMGVMNNVAEISQDYNEKGVPDKDSTPDNKKNGEDDIDDAPVMLSISTGQAKTYFTLGFIILVTIAGGVALIKKYVLL